MPDGVAPSRTVAYERVRELDHGRYTFGEAKQRRSVSRGATLERLDAYYWADVRYRRTPRYCPACLADTAIWADTWQHPYHLACTVHGLLLEVACPRCEARPLAKPTWLTHDGPPAACHDFIDATSGTRYRVPLQHRPDPDPDEPGAPGPARRPGLAMAGRHRRRPRQDDHRGWPLPVDAATGYEAAAEIITDNTLDPAVRDVRHPEHHGLTVAQLLLTQPTLQYAAGLAAQVAGFHPQEGAAPIGPQHRVQHRPRNPVTTAISLQQHQGSLAVSAELKFRVGTPVPCYPAAWNITTTPLTPANALPDLPMATIPATLWPGAVTLGEVDLDTQYGVGTPLGRTFAAIALARYASTRGWRLLALGLGLPAHCASTGARHWHRIDQAGLWPSYVRAIAAHFGQLHAGPPPIDYEQRRITARPDRILRAARHAVAGHPGVGVTVREFATALLSRYPGGDPSLYPR